MNTIAVIRLGRLGDVTLTGPTIKNLRFLYPDARIVFVTREMYRLLAKMLPGVDDVIAFPNDGNYFDLVELSSRIDEFDPDLMVDLHKNFRSFHLSAMTKAPYKVVYHKRRKGRQAAVNQKKFVSPVPHTIDLYNGVIDELKGVRLARLPDLALPKDVLSGNGFRRDGVAIVPGASAAVKAWPPEKFAELAERIIYDFKFPVRVLLGKADAGLKSHFQDLPDDLVSFLIDRPLPEVAALLSSSRLTVTNDSGLMHVSSAVGTPTAALFGPTHEQLGFSPKGVHDIVLGVDEPCRPCSLHGNKACYRDKQYCFTRLTVDMVYEKVAGMLDQIKLDPAVFVDRDGTLIIDDDYLADPDKIEFLPGSMRAIENLKTAGYKIVVVSNQSGVARGFFTAQTVDVIHEKLRKQMREKDAEPDDVRYCPHLADGDVSEFTLDCDCRKPKGGMLEDAARKLGLDLKRSFMIGDKYSDIQCGLAVGPRSILVRTGKGADAEKHLPTHENSRPYHISDDLAAAADYIVNGK